MNNDLKKLTGKNPHDFEAVAFNLGNKPDTNLFSELVVSEDFLFDFVKQNAEKSLFFRAYFVIMHMLTVIETVTVVDCIKFRKGGCSDAV